MTSLNASAQRKTTPQKTFQFKKKGLILLAVLTGLWTALGFRFPQESRTAHHHPKISFGEELLLDSVSNSDKLQGIKAFRRQDYLEAIQHFQISLLQQPNDPEAQIYLNNARSQRWALAQNGSHPAVRIAVSVPAGKNPTIAQEMLRGIAQAQSTINELGINGAKLEIVIVNDNNNAAEAKARAAELIADSQILAVIGSNASDPSLAAASVYQPAGLVMISPTSFSGKLSGLGSQIFRTIPNMKSLAEALAAHAIEVAKHQTIGICYDADSVDNVSFKDDFVAAYQSRGGKVLEISCDLSKTSKHAAALNQIRKQANAVMIAPHIDRQADAIALIEANAGKLDLFSTPTLYTSTILENTNKGLAGMVLAAPWYAERYSATSFLAQAEQRWGEESITWRTATSFDAVQAIATALRNIPPENTLTRSSLQAQLRRPDFLAPGAGESVEFLPSGDRAGQAILVHVQTIPIRETGVRYEFAAVTAAAQAALASPEDNRTLNNAARTSQSPQNPRKYPQSYEAELSSNENPRLILNP